MSPGKKAECKQTRLLFASSSFHSYLEKVEDGYLLLPHLLLLRLLLLLMLLLFLLHRN